MNLKHLPLAALLFATACNLSDPELNNETPSQNNKPDMSVALDMAQDLPAVEEDLPDAPDLPVSDLAMEDLGEPDMAMEDMEPDLPVGPDTIPIGQLKEKYFEALLGSYCTLVWSCEHPPIDLLDDLGRDDSYASCLNNELLRAQFGENIDQTLEAVRAGRISYDEEAAARCINPIIAQIKEATFCDDPRIFEGVNPECEQVFKGTIAVDGYCINSQECEPPPGSDNAYCDRSGSVCYGTCKDNPTMPNDCNGAICTADEFCFSDGSTRPRCIAKLRPGSACTQYDSCLGEDALCAYSSGAGTCVTRRSVAADGACIESSQCYSGAACLNGRCTNATLGGEGGRCGMAPYACKPGLTCSFVDFANNKRECAKPGVSGAPCYETSECRSELYCASAILDPQAPSPGRCTERKPDGKRCINSQECNSFRCDQDAAGVSVCSSPIACNLPN